MNFENRTFIPKGWVATYMKADFPTNAPDDMVFRPVDKEVYEGPDKNRMEMVAIPILPIAGVAIVVVGIGWFVMRKRGA